MATSFIVEYPTPVDNGSQAEPATLAIDFIGVGGTITGDLCIMIGQLQVTTAGQITLNATGGQSWTGPSVVTGANDQVMALWWCVFNGTWTVNPSMDFAAQSGTQPATAQGLAFRSSLSTTWLEDTAIAGGAEASADPLVVTDFTPVHDENVCLAIAMVTTAVTTTLSGGTWTSPNALKPQVRNTAGSDQTMLPAYQVQTTKAATSDASFNLSAAASGISFTMAWYAVVAATLVDDPEVDIDGYMHDEDENVAY